MERATTPRRDGGVDLVKSLAICAVLFIHCTSGHFASYQVGSHRWLAASFYGSVSRWAVPAFLMCSGALMNDPERDLPLKKLFSRYLLRLFAALTVWGAFYELFRISTSQSSAPLGALLREAAENLFYGKTYYHLYYFYFVFALYLALPLTRLAARSASEGERRYILAVWLISGGLIRSFQYFWPLNQMSRSMLFYSMPAAFLCPGLGLLGWYMRRHPPKSWAGGLGLFAGGLAVTLLGTWRRSLQAGTLDQFYLDGFGFFVLMMAVGAFRLCQWVSGRWSHTPKAVRVLSGASFCVYLVHPFFQHQVMPERFLSMAVYWSVPLQAAVLLALSLLVYAALRRVPVVNRWLI